MAQIVLEEGESLGAMSGIEGANEELGPIGHLDGDVPIQQHSFIKHICHFPKRNLFLKNEDDDGE